MLTALNALLEKCQGFLARTKDKLDERSTLKNRALVYLGVLVAIALTISIIL